MKKKLNKLCGHHLSSQENESEIECQRIQSWLDPRGKKDFESTRQ